jgi:hypothetical protein
VVARISDPGELPACVLSAMLTGHEPPSKPLSCDDIRACLHADHPTASNTYCATHPGAMTGCDSTTLVSCGDDDPGESTRTDCAALGATCGEIAQAGGLRTHACVDAARCPPELTRAWCDGTEAVLSCHDGEIERTACGDGAKCRAHSDADGEQIAMCEVPGHASCDAPGSRRCDGSRLVECEAHGHFGHRHTVDCSALGLACSPQDGGANCTNPTPTCYRGHPTCEGGALAFCASGLQVLVDCAEIGMGPCEADGIGPNAACRPRGAR